MSHSNGRSYENGEDRIENSAPTVPVAPAGGVLQQQEPCSRWELLESSSSVQLNEDDEEEEDEDEEEDDGNEGAQYFYPLPLEDEDEATAATVAGQRPLLLPYHRHQHRSLFPWVVHKTPILGSRGSIASNGSETGRKRRRHWLRALPKFFYLPPASLRWLSRYDRQQFVGDVLGGLTVAVMVIPQGMSYAVLADLPPVYGLFCALTGPLLYTLLGTSKHLSIGPVALVSLSLPRVYEILYPNLAQLPEEEATQARIQAATSITFVAGLVLVGLALLRLGMVSRFIPPAVMVGFTNAAAISIGISQIKELLGLKGVPRFDYTWETCLYVLSHLGEGQLASSLIGFGCIVFLLGIKHLKTRYIDRSNNARLKAWFRFLYPLSNLILVAITSSIARVLVGRGVEMAVVKDVPGGLPSPTVPRLDHFWTIVAHSLSIVLVAFMEAYAIAKKYALQEGYPLHINKELMALGCANFAGSFFSSYPVSGSFSRTAVSFSAGTQTQLANTVSAAVVVVALKYLAPFFYYIPRATLGAIIEVALINLLDLQTIKKEYERSKLDLLVAIVTFCVTLVFDTELGLLAGLGTSAAVLYWMPRGGALLIRLSLSPALKRRGPCDLLVVDLGRLLTLPTCIRMRLHDYLRYERRARAASPFLMVIIDGGMLNSCISSSGSISHSNGLPSFIKGKEGQGKEEAIVQGCYKEDHREKHMVTVIKEVLTAAESVGVPSNMVTVVGLPVKAKAITFDTVSEEQNSGSNGRCGSQGGEGEREGEESLLWYLPEGVLSPEQVELAQELLIRAFSVNSIAEYGQRRMMRLLNN